MSSSPCQAPLHLGPMDVALPAPFSVPLGAMLMYFPCIYCKVAFRTSLLQGNAIGLMAPVPFAC